MTLVAAPPPPSAWRNWLWLLLIAAIFALFYLLPTGSLSTSLTYTKFVHLCRARHKSTSSGR
jgi:hypothetical protein